MFDEIVEKIQQAKATGDVSALVDTWTDFVNAGLKRPKCATPLEGSGRYFALLVHYSAILIYYRLTGVSFIAQKWSFERLHAMVVEQANFDVAAMQIAFLAACASSEHTVTEIQAMAKRLNWGYTPQLLEKGNDLYAAKWEIQYPDGTKEILYLPDLYAQAEPCATCGRYKTDTRALICESCGQPC
jgi:hypothetical protein